MTTIQDYGVIPQLVWLFAGIAFIVYDFKKSPRRTLDIAHVLMILFGPICWTCFLSSKLYISFRKAKDPSFDLNDTNSLVAVRLVMAAFGMLPWCLLIIWLETH